MAWAAWASRMSAVSAKACPALGGDHRRGFLGAFGHAVDAQHGGPLASEQQGHGAAVADRLARRLASSDNDGALAGEPTRHFGKAGSRTWPSSSCTPKLFSIMHT